MVYSNWKKQSLCKKSFKQLVENILKTMKLKKLARNQKNVRIFYGATNEYFDYDKVVFALMQTIL